MRKYLFCLFIAFSISFTQTPQKPYSFSYDSLEIVVNDLDRNQKEMKNFIDSLNSKFISDNFITLEALTKSQMFYDSAFDKIYESYSTFLSRIEIIVAIAGVIATLVSVILGVNWWQGKKYNEEMKKDIESAKEKFSILDELKEGIEETLRKDREKNQDDFNAAYKKIAEAFYVLASEKLTDAIEGKKEEHKNEHWIGHFMNLAAFYFNLSRMSTFTGNELYFIGFIKEFTVKYKEKNMPMPGIKFFYHFLQFIKYSEKIDKAVFREVKMIYNELLGILDSVKVKEHIKKSGFGEERIQKILTLAERYENPPYPPYTSK